MFLASSPHTTRTPPSTQTASLSTSCFANVAKFYSSTPIAANLCTSSTACVLFQVVKSPQVTTRTEKTCSYANISPRWPSVLSRTLQKWFYAVLDVPAEFYCQALMRIVSMLRSDNPMIICTLMLYSQGQKLRLVTINQSESKRTVVAVATTSIYPRCDPNQGGGLYLR